MTELLGGPHINSLEKRVGAVLTARITYWESKAIEKLSAIKLVQQDEKCAKSSDHADPEVNAPGAMAADGSRRDLVDTFLATRDKHS
jgi:hypothetical protein